jgi:hypothetical protein
MAVINAKRSLACNSRLALGMELRQYAACRRLPPERRLNRTKATSNVEARDCCELGRQNYHTLSGLCVCCERALKSAGERSTHGRAGAGTFGKPPARGTLSFES